MTQHRAGRRRRGWARPADSSRACTGLAVAARAGLDPASLTPEEQTYLDDVETWQREEGGYQHQQSTRPVTLAHGLSDSPAGLLAWLVEEYRAWSDCHGEMSRRFSDEFVLTQASLYWFTNTISTSSRPYDEHVHGMRGAVTRVDVPTALAVTARTVPRSASGNTPG